MAGTCLVAGAGPGLGLAIARRFAREGFAPALLARRQEALDEMAETLGGGARGYAVDLTDPTALRASIERAAAEMGAFEVCVYNASGVFQPADPMTIDVDAFDAQVRLCVTGALVAAQTVFPAMQAAGRGTILFTGGGLALTPETGGQVAALTVGKTGLRALAKALAPVAADAGVHLATLTVAGPIAPDTAFAPDKIADRFWALHAEPQDAWSVERIFRGEA